ncbi:Hsp20/alpha crystallin family protein [Albidovulum sp.]
MQIKDLIPWARKDQEPDADRGTENPIVALQRELDRVFDSFRSRFGEVHWPWGRDEPRSDVVGTDDAVEVTIELPGMEMKDLEVTVAEGLLTVKGEKKIERQEEKKGYYLSERSYGAIYRTIPLPPGVDADKAEAAFKNGVLTVRIPHSPEARSKIRHIEVKGA